MRKFLRRAAAVAVVLVVLTGVALAAPAELVVGGNTLGLQLRLDGVSIVEFSEVSGAQKAGLQKGDVILRIDGKRVSGVEGISRAVEASEGRVLELLIGRDGREFTKNVAPLQTEDGWRLGIFVRDSITGIGTVTYYDPQTGTYGALGHGVNDGTSTDLLPLRRGTAKPSRVVSVRRGEKGDPGALQGVVEDQAIAGTIDRNTLCGIFGRIDLPEQGKTLPVAQKEEVRTGPATICCNVSGSAVEEYGVCIEEIYIQGEQRNLLLKVEDPTLLTLTGGIVQGMSGSPIIQNGKLVGAVTHVLVNDPTQGYGIFIENMLDAAA